MLTTRRSGRTLAAAAVAVSLLLSGCGSDNSDGGNDGGGAAPTSDMSPDELYQAAQDNGETELTLYSSLAGAWKPVFDAFSEQYPEITVNASPICCADQYTRLQQEFSTKKYTADVVQVGPQQITDYVDAGWVNVFDASDYEFPEVSKLDDGVTMPSGTAFGIVYNKDVITEPPASWEDLLKPEFKGKIVMQDVTKVSGVEAALTNLLINDEIGEDFVQGLRDQDPKIVSALQDYAPLIASGESPIGVAFPLSFFKAIESSGPFGLVFPVQGNSSDSKQFIAAQAVFASSQAPHPNAAALFVSWIYTPEGQAAIASAGDYPLVVGTKASPEGFPPADDFIPLPTNKDQEATDQKYTAEWTEIFN